MTDARDEAPPPGRPTARDAGGEARATTGEGREARGSVPADRRKEEHVHDGRGESGPAVEGGREPEPLRDLRGEREEQGLPDRQVALIDLLDRLLSGGVVLTGDVVLSIADIDLVRISLRAVIVAITRDEGWALTPPPPSPGPPAAGPGSDAVAGPLPGRPW